MRQIGDKVVTICSQSGDELLSAEGKVHTNKKLKLLREPPPATPNGPELERQLYAAKPKEPKLERTSHPATPQGPKLERNLDKARQKR